MNSHDAESRTNRVSFDPASSFTPEGLSDLVSSMASMMGPAMVEAVQAEKWSRDGPRRTGRTGAPGTSVPAGTGMAIGSGVEFRAAARTDGEQATIGVHSKHDRGLTNYDRDKRRKAAVEPFVTKLSCTNVARILTSNDLEKHDIAAECAHSQ